MTEETHYENVEQALDAMHDKDAGLQPEKPEASDKPYYRTVEDAEAAMHEEQAAIADVNRYERLNAKSESNRKEMDSTYQLGDDTKSQIANYTQKYNQFARDYQGFIQAAASIDLKRLEKTDAGRAALVMQKLGQAKAQLEGQYNELAKSGPEIRKNAAREVVERERTKLYKAAPELADPAMQRELTEYLLANGATREEIDSAIDHRTVLGFYKAMQHDKAMQKKKGKIVYKQPGGETSTDLPPKATKARARFEATRSMSDLRAFIDAKADAAIAPKQSKPVPRVQKENSKRIEELRAIVAKSPNSRDAFDATTELFTLQRRMAHA